MNQCPNCGYCPHCGRSRQYTYPYYPYQYPPYTYTGGTIQSSQTTVSSNDSKPGPGIDFDYTNIQSKLDALKKCEHD